VRINLPSPGMKWKRNVKVYPLPSYTEGTSKAHKCFSEIEFSKSPSLK
jgi:hypothetical protein